MREYEAVAVKQKEVLVKEAKLLKVRYSEDIQESQRMERTMNNIISMISEFAQLIEGQTTNVQNIGEVSLDTTASVKSADAELLLALERSQSHQWSMIGFILGMSFLLIVLDFVTP
jgi:t-SNARE complex subunit (syntaxin)